jgi:hypothetical protein
MQFEINTYYDGKTRETLNNSWQHAETMITDLILISGQLYTATERAQVIKYLQDNLGPDLNRSEWIALGENPGCYPSHSCSGSFKSEFTAATQALVQAVQVHLANGIIADIEQKNTIFQPMPCRDLHIC